ncbi:hypothetical protein LINPERHAP2_LOCUS35350 [Linum perenne]
MTTPEISEPNPRSSSAPPTSFPRPLEDGTLVGPGSFPATHPPDADSGSRKRPRDAMNPLTHVSDLERPSQGTGNCDKRPAAPADTASRGVPMSYSKVTSSTGWFVAPDVENLPLPPQPMSESVISNPRCPRIQFSDEEVKSFYLPWSKALVVKVLEKSFSLTTMKRLLEALWARSGPIQVSDLANNFFLVRFASESDYSTATFGGPWKIFDFYIAVAKWSPSFNEEEPIQSILTWVRLPRLPIHYFNPVAVKRIGDHIGRIVRLDLATKEGARGRFARVCVEIDISKLLLGKYMIEDRTFKIEYESLENICFDCGFYGHKKDVCLAKAVTQAAESASAKLTKTDDVVVDQEVGEWMTVQRRNQRKPAKITEPPRSQKPVAQGFTVLQVKETEPAGEDVALKDQKEAASTSGLHDKNFDNIASSLRKVLDEAILKQPEEGSMVKLSHDRAPRQTLRDITNSQISKAADKAHVRDDPMVGMEHEIGGTTANLVNVPVVYQNPTFQAEARNVKANQPKISPLKRGQNLKGTPPEPSSSLIRRNKKIDSQAVVAILRQTSSEITHSHGLEVLEFQEWMGRDWEVKLKHVYREVNHATDHLASRGHAVPRGSHLVENTDRDLAYFVRYDFMGISEPRLII